MIGPKTGKTRTDKTRADSKSLTSKALFQRFLRRTSENDRSQLFPFHGAALHCSVPPMYIQDFFPSCLERSHLGTIITQLRSTVPHPPPLLLPNNDLPTPLNPLVSSFPPPYILSQSRGLIRNAETDSVLCWYLLPGLSCDASRVSPCLQDEWCIFYLHLHQKSGSFFFDAATRGFTLLIDAP